MVLWRFTVFPTLQAGPGDSHFVFALRLMHPLADLCLILGVASVLLRCPRGTRRNPMLLLLAPQVLMLVADGLWARAADDRRFGDARAARAPAGALRRVRVGGPGRGTASGPRHRRRRRIARDRSWRCRTPRSWPASAC